ncbi:NYN domain-containing protein [Patescibacteria group bacterium]
MCLDLENLVEALSLHIEDEKQPSLLYRLDDLVKRISREFGEVVGGFFFLPPHLVNRWTEILRPLRFFFVVCPKVIDKQKKLEDTADETMIEHIRFLKDNIEGLTHICIATGDQDFAPVIRETVRKGLKIIIIAGSYKSLSEELKRLADKDMLFILEESN